MENGQALVKDDEDCKSREFFPGQGQQMLQVGDKMDGIVKEIDRKVSELGSGRSCSRPACKPWGHISNAIKLFLHFICCFFTVVSLLFHLKLKHFNLIAHLAQCL